MTDSTHQPTMAGKVKLIYFFLTLLVMTNFAMVGIKFAEQQYGYAALFAAIALLLTGAGFSMKKRFLK